MLRCASAVLAVLALGGLEAGSAGAQGTDNPWLERRVIDLAHQGGEWEAPSNTVYALRRAVRLGADMLELDVHATADDRLVVIHDATVDRTTNGSGLVSETKWRALRRLDAAYNFVPGRNAVPGLPANEYPLRGVRTGERPPPGKPGRYKRRDFAIPTLSEVFRRFPKKPINIEIKGDSDSDFESFAAHRRAASRRSSTPTPNAPTRSSSSPSTTPRSCASTSSRPPRSAPRPDSASVAAYFTTGVAPTGDHEAIQIPVQFEGVRVATPEFIARAHADGFAVHIFPDHEEENDDLYPRAAPRCASTGS